MRKKLGMCGVDSGQLLVIDPCYLKEFVNDDFQVEDKPEGKNYPLSYKGCCFATLSDNRGGEVGNLGVAASTYYGDGCYPVYFVSDERGHRLEVLFDEPEDDESEDEPEI